MAPVCWFAERMKTLTRSSPLTTARVGPSRFASTGVRVLVSERWTFFCSSGALVSSGRGACTASLIDENSNPVSFRVRLLQSLGDLLHPAQLSEARAAYDHPAREREPRLKGSAEEAEPGQARRVDLRTGSFEVGRLGVQRTRTRLELDRASDVGEPQQRSAGFHIVESIAHGIGSTGGGENAQHQLRHVVPRSVHLHPHPRLLEPGGELFLGHVKRA